MKNRERKSQETEEIILPEAKGREEGVVVGGGAEERGRRKGKETGRLQRSQAGSRLERRSWT